MVQSNSLTSAQADQVELAAVVFHLTGGSVAATRGVLNLTAAGTGGTRLREVSDLVGLSDADWRAVINESGVAPPSGMTSDDLIQEMTHRVALVVPSDFLAQKAAAVPEGLAALVEAVAHGNGEARPEPLVRLARRNPGLGLDDVLDSSDEAPAKVRELERLVGLAADAWSSNPGKNLLELDHSPDSPDLESLKLPDVDDVDRERILKNLRAHQRAFLVGRLDAGTALTLLDSGFDAARKIVALNPDEFGKASGLPPKEAVVVHYAATKAATAATLKSVAVHQIGKATTPAPVRTSEDARDYLVKIPGYSTLFPDDFGFCDCEDCGSVLGLPAYFVDLMFFVETNILDHLPPPAQLPIHLKGRRDDLWTLDLTCEHANEVVAYLDLVNEILEKHVSKQLGLPQGADVWGRIAEKNPSFALPFDLPLARIETYLGHFGKRRLDAAVAFGADESVRARARLGLSEIDAEMIATPAAVNFTGLTPAETAFLSELYGELSVYQNGSVESTGFSVVFVSQVLDVTGASREELGELLATAFVVGAARPTIRSGRSSPASIQNDTEVIEGLKAGHLDRLHRFYRLSRHVPWTVPELDRTLSRLTGNALCSGLDDKALLRIARLLELEEQLGLSVEELCGLWSELPNDELDGQPGLFDALFNAPQLASLGTPIPYTDTPLGSFQHPSFNPAGTSVPPDDNTLARLLVGLRVSDQELVQLLVKLALPLGLGPNSKLALSIRNLTLLYRHATLARCLGVTVAGLFQLLEVAGLPAQIVAGKTARSVREWSLAGANLVDDVGAVLATHGWTSESAFTADETAFLTGGSVVDQATLVAAEKRVDADAVVEAVVTQLLADRAFEFADTVLSGTPNGADRTLTEDESRRIVEANAALFEAATGQTALRLKKELSAADVTIPGPATEFLVTAAEVAAQLLKHSVHTLLPPAIAKALDFSLEKTTPLFALSGTDATLTSSQFRDSFVALIYGDSNDGGELTKLVSALAPYAVLYRGSVYDQSTLEAIYRDRAVFAVDVRPLTTEAVRLATRFDQLATGPDPAYATSAPTADVAAVLEVVHTGVSTATSDVLARALRTDAARIDALSPHLTATLPASRLDALGMMVACLELTALLEVSGETLYDLALAPGPEREYERLRRSADALFAAFRTKYASEAEFQQKVEPYEDMLRSLKRDGLVAFICFTEPEKFRLENDLYEYFLVDVAVEGCARTTRVAAAIFTLQLYVHRVLMHLEQSENYDVGDHAVIPRDEWDWRRHYRLWQANRRVFLYPENYLEPGLRDDKTPLFTELEDALLQQQIGEQNVRDAYATYLTGFDEIAALKISAACWQRGDPALESPDVLHLFGVTSSEPPVFYYRAIGGLEKAADTKSVQFEPWRKIDLQISSKTCSTLIYRGTLYVFWAEITTRPKTTLVNGSSKFTGYKHKLALKFSSLRLDGRWSAPQRLRILRDGKETQSIEVDDPLMSSPTTLSTMWQTLAASARAMMATSGLTDQQKADWRQIAEDDDAKAEAALAYVALLDPLKTPQPEPLDDYTLTDPVFATPYPFATAFELTIYVAGDLWTVDLFHRTAISQIPLTLHPATPLSVLTVFFDSLGQVRGVGEVAANSIMANEYAASAIALDTGVNNAPSVPIVAPVLQTTQFDAIPVNGGTDAAVVTIGQDAFYIHIRDGLFATVRLGSTIADEAAETLVSSSDGLARVLDVSYQVPLEEAALPLTVSPAGPGTPAKRIGFTGPAKTVTGPGGGARDSYPIDFRGAVGDYYREIWCHIPWVIADYLHSQGQYADAKRWYEAIFDPAAGSKPTANPAYKRVWQFREFREELIETMRAALDNAAEVSVYEHDPFSPHAIARLRPGAYEKAMVMQYIDNLLDWGDSLFTQFSAESINEATMLYILALDILGPRARDAGDCGEEKLDKQGNPIKKDYEHLAPALRAGHEFVIEAENLFVIEQVRREPSQIELAKGIAVAAVEAETGGFSPAGNGAIWPLGWQQPGPAFWTMSGGTPLSSLQLGGTLEGPNGSSPLPLADGRTIGLAGDPRDPPLVGPPGIPGAIRRGGYAGPSLDTQPGLSLDDGLRQLPSDAPQVQAKPWQLLDSSIAFCIPDNKELRGYWDRVESRLSNIRHCRDIDGTQRLPDLFGPEIDPRLLIKLKAAGLTLDDVLNVTSGNVPPYRFTYLLEKARQYATTVQSFGGALLAALEKRDGETLANLRTAHEQHLLTMRTQLQELEVNAAEQTRDGLALQQQAAEYRRDYYRGLSQTGLSGWERTQQVSRHTASGLQGAAGIVDTIAGIAYLVPQIGSPFAMKYGGQELGNSANAWATVLRDAASVAEAISSSAGLEATFQRRDDDWKQQAALAQREVDQLKRQVAAAEFRIQIAEHTLDVHNETLDQTEELYQFSKDRFTSLGLYTFLSTTLQRLYRDAFNSAFSMALLAEQAYRFERPADQGTLLQREYWDPLSGGLLAGERLILDLQGLERRYLETDYRQLEIEQSFSLAQYDPAALAALREMGECAFEVPELFFDLAYPGHYRRRIKAVRLSLPCVVGPYASASATLKLVGSELRLEPEQAPAAVPPRHSISIAASSGQNDGGVFEFNFRDERYMPFEGSGAVSNWQLSLPKSFRPFNYGTISDVVLQISYTAEYDEELRKAVDDVLGTAAVSIRQRLQTDGMPLLLSLRRDMPDVWRNLVTSPAGTDVDVTIDERRLPTILADWLGGRVVGGTNPGKKPQVSFEVKSILVDAWEKPDPGKQFGMTARAKSIANPTPLTFGARGADGLFPAAFNPTLTVDPASTDVELVLNVTGAGNLAPPQPTPPAPPPTVTIDEAKLRDMMILANLKISTS